MGRSWVGSVVLMAVAVLIAAWPSVEAVKSHARLLPEAAVLPSADNEDADESAVAEMIRVQRYGYDFMKRRTECSEDELSLVSTDKNSLWYSEDGLIRKRFVAQSYDAHGYQVTRELPLRLGDNWHLVFELKQKGRGLSQTHFITVFQHIVESHLTVTQHTWEDILVNAPLQGENVSPEQSAEAATPSPFIMTTSEDESLIATFVSSLSPILAPLSVQSSLPESSAEKSTARSSCMPIKVATFNIWNLNEPWERRLEMINDHMMTEKPDIIGWQEVRYDISQTERAQVDQLINLPAFKGFQFVWERAMTYLNFHSIDSWHIDEGLAIFSRFPILQADRRILSRDMSDGEDREHQRACLRARIRPVGCSDINFFVTHMTLSNRARERTAQEIAEWVASFDHPLPSSVPFVFASYPPFARKEPDASPIPAVLVGDMNTEPSSRTIDYLLGRSVGSENKNPPRASFIDAWLVRNPMANSPQASKSERGFTFPTWKPRKRIDFILVKREVEGKVAIDVLDIQLMGNVTLRTSEDSIQREVSSDHLGLWASLALPSAASATSPIPLGSSISIREHADEL